MSMNIRNENIITWILRIIVSGLFILSAFSKLLPANTAIYLFEKQIVDFGITNWCYAPLMARAIIAFELFLSIAILQNHFLKKAIVPATFLLLLVFCIHLTITIIQTGNSGSCGCFGQLIPMTPLEAIIKNVICMAMLVFIYIKFKSSDKNLFRYPVTIFIIVYLGIFIFFQPKCCCASSSVKQNIIADTVNATGDSIVVVNDTTSVKVQEVKKDTSTAKKETKVPLKPARKKFNSIFTKYTKFNVGNIDLNSGKKIVCLFSLDCEHCQESSKILQGLKKKHVDFPGVYILAFGEESQVDNFFSAGGGKFPYTLIPPEEFFPLLDQASFPPRIVVMDNGNFLGEFINFEHLDTNAVMNIINK
jgi:hypothetical protein